MTKDTSREAAAHLEFLSNWHYHQVYGDGSDGADHIEPIRAELERLQRIEAAARDLMNDERHAAEYAAELNARLARGEVIQLTTGGGPSLIEQDKLALRAALATDGAEIQTLAAKRLAFNSGAGPCPSCGRMECPGDCW